MSKKLKPQQLAAIRQSQGAAFIDLKEARIQVALLLGHIAALDDEIAKLREARAARKESPR